MAAYANHYYVLVTAEHSQDRQSFNIILSGTYLYKGVAIRLDMDELPGELTIRPDMDK